MLKLLDKPFITNFKITKITNIDKTLCPRNSRWLNFPANGTSSTAYYPERDL